MDLQQRQDLLKKRGQWLHPEQDFSGLGKFSLTPDISGLSVVLSVKSVLVELCFVW